MPTNTKNLSHFNNDTVLLCQTIYAVTGISIFLLNSELQITSSYSKFEAEMKNFFFLNCPYNLKKLLHSDSMNPLHFSDSLYLNWILLPVIGDCALLVLGPVFDTDVTASFFQKEMNFKKMSVSSQIRFLKMVSDIPVIPFSQHFQYASMLYHTIYRMLPKKNILFDKTASTGSPYILSDKSIRNIPNSHGSRLPEKLMLEVVRTGNIHLLEQIDITSQAIIGTLSNGDPLRQNKNSIIIQITLVTRAAVDGGMDAEAAYSLSDYYIQKVELCQTLKEISDVSNRMYHDFIEQVRQIRTLNYNPVVSYMCSYIDKHITDVISLSELSDSIGYDTYYLTTLFKKDTGKTIKAYILEKKVDLAKILLSSTLMEVQEISDHLSFKSLSYFCTQFKKITGESPLSYRKRSNSQVEKSE